MPSGFRAPRRRSRFVDILQGRDFRLLWGGEFVSLLGNQFFTVALPWLVLQLTGDALAIGAIMAVGAAPRTVFILLGGALIDRFDPRRVMLYSNVTRMGLVAVIAILTAVGAVHMWTLYVVNFFLGLGYALYLPAQSAMIPRLIRRDDELQTGNAVIQGTAQLSLFLGPVVAGVLIAFLGKAGPGGSSQVGLSVAFALNALTFLVSAVTLSRIRLSPFGAGLAGGAPGGSVLRALFQGLGFVWRDPTLRYYFLLIGVVNLVLLGPLAVGIPVLANTRFAGGALAYGAILSGLGAGALAGIVAGGVLPRPPGKGFAAALLASVAVLGVGLALVGALPSAAGATIAAFFVGVAEGYLTVQFITWLQLRTPREQLGRMMSILLFVSVGQAPVSNLVAGALIAVNAPLVMVGAGTFIVLVGAIAALSPPVWKLSCDNLPSAGHTC